jgi:hypothetical protein
MAAGEFGGLGGTGSASGIWRALDASANRAAEALRVLEDVLRFGLDDGHLTRLAKDLRHDLAAALTRHGLGQRTAARDVGGDVGVGIEAEAGLSRAGLADLVAANAARAAQALRSLQECSAVVAPEASGGFESIRYRLYTLERAATTALTWWPRRRSNRPRRGCRPRGGGPTVRRRRCPPCSPTLLSARPRSSLGCALSSSSRPRRSCGCAWNGGRTSRTAPTRRTCC